MPSSDNKRIAKNTMFLYLRMILTILVSLYTVRVIWQVLGVDDYGVYNVVGGIVTMFAFLNNAMVASSQRFISYELGTRDKERLNRVFSISMTVHFMLAVIILLLAETVGLWFLNEKLNIPSDRMIAANWVYQCSIVAFMVNIISVPYNACIVAHEHMKIYGYLGILDVLLKLGIVFLLIIIPFDKLITYAILVVMVSVVMRIIYAYYCRYHFTECHYHYHHVPDLMRDMFSFAGWSFIGNLGFSVRDQGLNIVVNLFFNVAVNAAKGIASHIGTVISGFALNFQMALNPQITKRYAAGEIDSMMSLVFSGCKYSVLLMSLIVIPLYFAAEPVLRLWLGDVAPYTVGFMQLVLIMSLIDSMVNPLTTALQATGRIKWFQIIISIIMIANIPLVWIWLKLDLNPYIVLYVSILTSIIALIARLILLHNEVSFSFKEFIRKVIYRIVPVIAISYFVIWLIYTGMHNDSLLYLIAYFIASIIFIGLTIYILGLESSERRILINAIINKVKR